MKGLCETIADMEGAETKVSGDDEEEEEEEWVDEVVGEGGEGGEVREGNKGAEGGTELLLAKFDDIEAEIESVLELVQSEEEEEERNDDDDEEKERGVESKRMGGAHRDSVTFPQTRISLPQESVEVVKQEQLSPYSWRMVEEHNSPPPPLRKEHRSIQMSLLGAWVLRCASVLRGRCGEIS